MSHYDCDYCGVNPKSNEGHGKNCPENQVNKLINKAWLLYCEETWTVLAADSWDQLSEKVQKFYIDKATGGMR